jgi:hypothetical protein
MTPVLNLPFTTINNFSLIQSFYADSEIVNRSGEVSLTSVSLYFKSKPSPTKNASGKANPGVSIAICRVRNDEPVISEVYADSIVRREYGEIFSFSDASSPTTFGFTTPLKLKTNEFYGIVVIFDDPAYELWINKQGDKLVGTNTPSPGSNIVKDGKLYLRNNSNIFRAISDTDLKFNVSVAKYVSNTTSIIHTNKDYEFFDTNTTTGAFLGGEWVYKQSANATGNVAFTAGKNTITGIGTTFTSYNEGTRIVLHGNTSTRQVFTIQEVVNNTLMIVTSKIPFTNNNTKFAVTAVGRVYYKDNVIKKLFLVDSNANTTVKFAANDTVIGVDSGATANIVALNTFSMDRIKIRGDLSLPAAGRISNRWYSAIWNGSNYIFNTTNSLNVQLNDTRNSNINRFDAFMLSRSLEVDNSNLFTNTDLLIERKSLRVDTDISVNASNTNLYQSPTIDKGKIDMYVIQNKISNTFTTTDANSVVIDSEVGDNGVAVSRHITSKVTFANNRFAEDIRVFMTAYRPANTNLRVYARVHNSADPEAFDDKSWTPLVYVENEGKFSSNEDRNDLIEYELGIPQFSETANALPGVFTTQLSNAVIVATGVTPTTYVAVNDVVKLYNPLIPDNYVVAVVEAANSTTITLGAAVANNNLVGSGFKVDRLKYYNTAFNNITNDNVARYYNTSLVEFDKFDSMQIKIVMLSDSTYVVPEVDQIQVIGVSA